MFVIRTFSPLAAMVLAATSRTAGSQRTETGTASTSTAALLFDFSQPSAVDRWEEVSDTVREVGKSKATLVSQQTQVFTRAILFALLNPQENGACFAGVRAELGRRDMSQFDGVALSCAGGGGLRDWKVILRAADSPELSYEAFFEVGGEGVVGGGRDGRGRRAQRVVLLFEQFAAFFRGAPVPDAPPLDLTNIVSFGLQTYGGVYNATQQSGPGALELDRVELVVIDDLEGAAQQ